MESESKKGTITRTTVFSITIFPFQLQTISSTVKRNFRQMSQGTGMPNREGKVYINPNSPTTVAPRGISWNIFIFGGSNLPISDPRCFQPSLRAYNNMHLVLAYLPLTKALASSCALTKSISTFSQSHLHIIQSIRLSF